jgi:hypothetical protein
MAPSADESNIRGKWAYNHINIRAVPRVGGSGQHPDTASCTGETATDTVLESESYFTTALRTRDLKKVDTAFHRFRDRRKRLEEAQKIAVRGNISRLFQRLRLPVPSDDPTLSKYGFNMDLIKSYSAFLRNRHGLLGNLIQLHRGETDLDSRPNKHLVVPEAEFPHKSRWEHIVKHGVIPTFHSPLPVQSTPPKNHKSWSEAFEILIRDVAKGQKRDEYLILQGDLLPKLMETKQIFLSPFGGAPKDGKPLTECARIVHDESFPRTRGLSINAATINIPLEIHHDGVKQIARWGLDESTRYPDTAVMMTGDVSGAFRHVPINCWFCGHFSGYIPELDIIVVNLSLPFGWTGSPVTYSIAGQAIKHIHNSRPGFHNLVYCDDHIMIDQADSFEARAAAISLRRAMIAVLGTTACNEDKFTQWARRCKALGLIFDFDSRTVTMPAPKIAKILGRLLALLDADTVSTIQLRETMGLLRYLGTCIPVARPFYNRLQALLCVLEKVAKPLKLQTTQAEDIRWLIALFQSDALQDMSMARLAGEIPPHDRINMDASDMGVCGVWHTRKLYFAVQWDEFELARLDRFKSHEDPGFSINYRELLGAYFSVILWSTQWRELFGREAHIRLVIDNTSAVSWTDTRNSKHVEAQHALRVMGLVEASNHVFTSSEHIPGDENSWADKGSRLWDSEDSLLQFMSISNDYVQVEVPTEWRCPSRAWSRLSSGNPSDEIARISTTAIGCNGLVGAK